MIFKTFDIRGKNSATFVASKCDIKRTMAVKCSWTDVLWWSRLRLKWQYNSIIGFLPYHLFRIVLMKTKSEVN